MSKTFRYRIKNEEQINKARELLKYHGTLNGSNFKVKGVEGYFEIYDDILSITITDKPFLASWSMVESELDKLMKSL